MIRKLKSGKYRLYSRKKRSEDGEAPEAARKQSGSSAVFQAALRLLTFPN